MGDLDPLGFEFLIRKALNTPKLRRHANLDRELVATADKALETALGFAAEVARGCVEDGMTLKQALECAGEYLTELSFWMWLENGDQKTDP
jgi:hypothetical protein